MEIRKSPKQSEWVSIRVSPDVLLAITLEAEKRDMGKSELIRKVIVAWLTEVQKGVRK